MYELEGGKINGLLLVYWVVFGSFEVWERKRREKKVVRIKKGFGKLWR